MAHLWPIGGGKGGSGKSFLTSSLGRLSAELGKKTLVIDLDLGSANLHTLVGVPYPQKGLSDFIRKKISRLEDAVVETPQANLFLISGAHDNFDIANLPYEQKIKTLRAITKLKYERILLDLGAGTSFNTLDFFLISQNGIFITTPEPTSVENVYRLIRAIYFRRIRYCFNASQFKALESETDRQFGNGAMNKPIYMMKMIAKTDVEKYRQLQEEFGAYRFKLVINQVRKHDNTALGLQMSRMMERHLGLHVEFAGNVAYDDHVHDAICQQVCFLERYSYTKTAGDLREVGKQVVHATGRQLMLHYM
ncbi:MAG: AAA family ATPase [Smithellaceae bacterium]|nr:AAA family ATPase [Smithellaceae bacterium]